MNTPESIEWKYSRVQDIMSGYEYTNIEEQLQAIKAVLEKLE